MRKMKIAVAMMALSLLSSIPAMANWNKGAGANSNRWWYENEDHSYAHSGWFWLDGNNDGVSESYYFQNDGYLLTNTTVGQSAIISTRKVGHYFPPPLLTATP